MNVMATSNHIKSVTAIGKVLGDGAKTTTVAMEPIGINSISTASYSVSGRTITKTYTNSEVMKSILPKKGRFVILELKSTISLTPDFGPDKKAKKQAAKWARKPGKSQRRRFCKSHNC